MWGCYLLNYAIFPLEYTGELCIMHYEEKFEVQHTPLHLLLATYAPHEH